MAGEMNAIPMRQGEDSKSELEVLRHWEEDGSLFVELSSTDRDALVKHARTFALDYVREADADAALGRWKQAGTEKVSPPVGYDPENPEDDPYKLAAVAQENKEKISWHYKQTVKLTTSII